MSAAEDPTDGTDPAQIGVEAEVERDPEAAFRSAYDEHLAEIWRFVRRRCDGADDADDATAEVFAVAWRRRLDLPPPLEARLWLYGVARNVLANQHRSARRRRRLHRAVADASATAPDTVPDPGEEREAEALWHALSSLDEADRDLLLLRSWDGLAVTEIATLLGCTPNAASLRLHKARGRLAAILAADADAPHAPDDGTGQTDPPGSRTSAGRSPTTEGDIR